MVGKKRKYYYVIKDTIKGFYVRIIGLGNDMVDIRRIEKSMNKYNGRFTRRIFTPSEIKYCSSKGKPASSFAKRFAAKEAFVKALGTGIAKGVSWQDINIVNDDLGKPSLEIRGTALKIIKKLIPVDMEYQLDVSLTDEYPYAQAVVIISVVKAVNEITLNKNSNDIISNID